MHPATFMGLPNTPGRSTPGTAPYLNWTRQEKKPFSMFSPAEQMGHGRTEDSSRTRLEISTAARPREVIPVAGMAVESYSSWIRVEKRRYSINSLEGRTGQIRTGT